MENFKEIGSEFWLDNLNGDDDCVYVLSGRTAIDLIIQDMESCGKRPSSVYIPAWCCDSMLQPFIDRDIHICFYDVSFENGHLSYHIEHDYQPDIFYVTNYFGFKNTISEGIIASFKKRGSIIIYDRTHSLFQEDSLYVDLADYSFASIRKWLGIPCGAYVSKNNTPLIIPPLKDYPYLLEKVDAMRLKAEYIQGKTSFPKQVFLEKFFSFGRHLADCYRDFKMDYMSLYLWKQADKKTLMFRRISNTAFLQSYLKEFPQIQTMFHTSGDDCCLFVPIYFETEEERNKVRRYLINNSIFCPIHWPKPKSIKSTMRVNNIYDHELSLICDQRYNENDMSRCMDILKKALETINP